MKQSFSDIALYHEYKSEKDTDGLLSAKTWSDLDMDDFFEWADGTSSCIGRQYLYDLLHYNRISEVAEHEELILRLSADENLRSGIQADLLKLDGPDAYSIASLFSISHPVYSRRFYRLLCVLQFLPFVLLGVVYITSSLFFLGLLCVSVLVNLFLHYRSKARIQGYFFSIPQLWRMLKQAEKLAKIPTCASVHENILETLSALHPLRKKLSAFRFSISLENDMAIIAYFFAEMVNVFFLREVISVSKAFFLLQGRREQIETVYRFFGLVDVLCSVSELRKSLPYYALPESCAGGETFHAEGLYHPLVEHCIPNDITLRGKSVLITGSNMSGKTTFIRAIGLSLICAQALHTCFAHSFRLPDDTKLASAIHMEDSLMEGKSFFLQEVQTIKDMLEDSAGCGRLFLLDELFKGTNTAERIAIAKAVLSALVRQGNIVFVSTHDIELASLLCGEYDLYHFCESVADNTLSFDYKLKSGPVTERNAIRIIEMCGYPQEVVQEAYQIAGKDKL